MAEINFRTRPFGTLKATPSNSSRTPYQHQSDALKTLDILNQRQSYSTLLALPTGGGKNFTATTWLLTHALNEGKKVLWLAHKHLLLDQAAESFSKLASKVTLPKLPYFNYRIISGAHQNSASIAANDTLLIASTDSICSHLERLDIWLARQKEIFLVIDEAHHATSKNYWQIINYLRAKVANLKVIGLTATPTRTAENEQAILAAIFPDGVRDGKYFNNTTSPDAPATVYKIGLRELVKQKILSRPKFYSCETQIKFGANLTPDAVNQIQAQDILPPELEDEISHSDWRNSLIVQMYSENANFYKQTIVFAVNNAHAEILTQRFKAAGVKAACIVAGNSQYEREKIYNEYRRGNLQVLVNVKMLTTGSDLPMTQTVFLTRPTTSEILTTQMIGKALRGSKTGGTEFAHVVSFADDWQQNITWANPESVYYEEIKFSAELGETLPPEVESEFPTKNQEELRQIAQGKALEFANVFSATVDTKSVEATPFLERIPLGMYAFSYETSEDETTRGNADNDSGDGNDVTCQIMVYHSTRDAYEQFLAILPQLFNEQQTLDNLVETCREKISAGEVIQPVEMRHVLNYYEQKGIRPKFYPFDAATRENLDVAKIALEIWDKDIGEKSKKDYLSGLWQNPLWRNFFVKKEYFIRMINIELEKLSYPEFYAAYQKPKLLPPPATPPANVIEGTDLTWKFEAGTLIISGTGDMRNYSWQTDSSAWYEDRNSITTIIVEAGVTSIGNEAFIESKYLSSVVLPDSVTAIGAYAFYCCESLKNIAVPNFVASIGEFAFYSCEALETITLPDDVTVGSAVFVGCTALKTIEQPTGKFFCDDSFVYEKISGGIKINSFIGTNHTVVIPSFVTAIGAYAFHYCESLKSVVIPDSITAIGEGAFAGCESLDNVIIPPKVTQIGVHIFDECKNLKNIYYKRELESAESLNEGNEATLVTY